MSRFRRLIHSVAAGYAVLIATAFYALASVPIALHYLTTREFGLWALMSTIAGYLSLIDLGLSSSVGRLLIDYKDQREQGTYGSLIQTGWLVLAVQGFIIFLVAFALAPLFCNLMAIDQDLRSVFIALLRWQGVILAVNFTLRIFSQVLQAHQRIDVLNYGQIASLFVSLASLWFFFSLGQKVFSLAYAMLLSNCTNAIFCLVGCARLKLFPPAGTWGRASWKYFREMFSYGKDLFLVSVGNQIIVASQIMLITRRLGLEAATAWNIGTRTYTLLFQATMRIGVYSLPALSEMIVRGEEAKLKERFRDVVILSASLAAYVAISFALCNSAFVEVWTGLSKGKTMYWPQQNDLLLGLWMVVLTILGCHNNFVLITKQIRLMPILYFIEGSVFVVLAWFASAWGGLPALIACSVFCSCVFTYAYGAHRTSQYFHLPITDVTGVWLLPMLKLIAFYGLLALPLGFAVHSLPVLPRLVILSAFSGTAGLAMLLKFGLPAGLRDEILVHSPGFVSPVIRNLFKTARSP